MQKIIPVKCPKCNNNQHFHKFGKDKFGRDRRKFCVKVNSELPIRQESG